MTKQCRPVNDELVGNTYSHMYHRSFCQSARLMGKGWVFLKNVKDAKSQGFKPCSNCKPDNFLVIPQNSTFIHFGSCANVKRSKPTKFYETLREAVWAGYEFKCGCNIPGVWEYVKRLEKEKEQEEESEGEL